MNILPVLFLFCSTRQSISSSHINRRIFFFSSRRSRMDGFKKRKKKNKGKEKGGERREKKCWKEEEERPLLLFSPFYVTLKYAKMNFLLLIRSINMPCMYNILIIEILIFFQEAALQRLFQDNLTFACKPISLMDILFILYTAFI